MRARFRIYCGRPVVWKSGRGELGHPSCVVSLGRKALSLSSNIGEGAAYWPQSDYALGLFHRHVFASANSNALQTTFFETFIGSSNCVLGCKLPDVNLKPTGLSSSPSRLGIKQAAATLGLATEWSLMRQSVQRK